MERRLSTEAVFLIRCICEITEFCGVREMESIYSGQFIQTLDLWFKNHKGFVCSYCNNNKHQKKVKLPLNLHISDFNFKDVVPEKMMHLTVHDHAPYYHMQTISVTCEGMNSYFSDGHKWSVRWRNNSVTSYQREKWQSTH